MKCLIVDDDVDFAQLLATSVQAWGHDSIVCHNWLSVMVKLKNNEVDLIIADVETPTGNGLSVIEYLSTDPMVMGIKKVFVTGLNDDTTKQRCVKLRSDYIHKSSTVMSDLKQYIADQSESLQAV